MESSNTSTDLITKALPAIEWLAENTDCPGLYDWCRLDGLVQHMDEGKIVPNLVAYNPPAVLVAICMWVNGEVVPFALENDPGLFQDICCPNPFDEGWHWAATHLLDGKSSTYPEATIALLLAIVECLRGGSDGA